MSQGQQLSMQRGRVVVAVLALALLGLAGTVAAAHALNPDPGPATAASHALRPDSYEPAPAITTPAPAAPACDHHARDPAPA